MKKSKSYKYVHPIYGKISHTIQTGAIPNSVGFSHSKPAAKVVNINVASQSNNRRA